MMFTIEIGVGLLSLGWIGMKEKMRLFFLTNRWFILSIDKEEAKAKEA